VKKVSWYAPANWILGVVCGISRDAARVYPCDLRGEKTSTDFVEITPAKRRLLEVGPFGIRFDRSSRVEMVARPRNGLLVVLEFHEGNVQSWTTQDKYRTALDAYDNRYSLRAEYDRAKSAAAAERAAAAAKIKPTGKALIKPQAVPIEVVAEVLAVIEKSAPSEVTPSDEIEVPADKISRLTGYKKRKTVSRIAKGMSVDLAVATA